MNKKLRHILKIVLPLALGVLLIWYSISSATPAEREKLWENISHADLFWVFLSIFCGFLSHFSRAYRWKYLLEPMGYQPKLANRFMAVMIAYLANLGIPRSGEVLRAATLTSYENVPFEKGFGTIISERIADLCMLLLIVGIATLLQTDNVLRYFSENNINPFMGILVLLVLLVLGLVFVKLIRKSTHPLLVKVKNFAVGLLEGMKSILRLKRKKAFLFHTFFIWAMYVLMFYVMKFAIPETSQLEIGAVLVAFVVGSFAISVTNGGIGIYPIAIGAVLVWYQIDQQSGEAFGWVIWGSQTLLNIVLGGLSFVLLPVFNRRK
ncbi:MAG TPA: lysylphosphatidylglycerol synthase transmembrane domain-containing protein [Flavobacteriaceae bacterium]|nr:lysylphosphatidylglycerol synthase transmembrane domain-containing protein [Flavobacteriaceae bacterium]